MLLATARQIDAAGFAQSRSKSVSSACPGKRSDKRRDEGREPSRTSAASHFPNPVPVSNRELSLLERGLSYCKQRKAALSNRKLWTIRNSTAPSRFICGQAVVLGHGSPFADRGSRPPTTFAAVLAAPKGASPEKLSALPNLNRQTREFRNAVTYRKQKTVTCSNRQNIEKWSSVFFAASPARPDFTEDQCLHKN
jgi:hypothetical protein